MQVQLLGSLLRVSLGIEHAQPVRSTLHGRPRDTGIGVPRGLAMAPLAHPQLPMAAAQQAALRRRCWRLPLYGEEWFRLLCMRVCVVRRVMMRQVTFVVSRVRVYG